MSKILAQQICPKCSSYKLSKEQGIEWFLKNRQPCELITIQDLARWLKKSAKTIIAMEKRGELPKARTYQSGKRQGYSLQELINQNILAS